jgi:hypothetical protein
MPYRMWRDLVNCGRYSDDFLRAYFEQWGCDSQARIDRLRQRRPPGVVEVPAVAEAFSRYGLVDASA